MSREAPVRTIGSVLLALFILALTFLALHHSSNGETVLQGERGLSFSVDFREPVAMRIAASAHYAIDTTEGAEEWSKLLPPSGHLVHLLDSSSPDSAPSKSKAYTVTLFHQLKCLDIIREQYLLPESDPISPMTEHCMNYLRQTVLCRPNLWLESAKNILGTASRTYDAVCHDWEKVYEAAARNREEAEELTHANSARNETIRSRRGVAWIKRIRSLVSLP